MDHFVGMPFGTSAMGKLNLEQILDGMERARVNRIMFIAQDPNGSQFQYNPEYYAFTRLKPAMGENVKPGDDPLGKVCDAARKRGMKVYAHNLAYECAWSGYWPAKRGGPDISSSMLRNFTACSQIDIFGRKNFRVCTNHPDYRQYYLSIAEDQLRNYPIEGVYFNTERNGPLSSVLVGNYAAEFGYRKPQAPSCFCPHCIAKAKDIGINIDRARQGWMELLEFSERSWREARKKGDPFAGEGTSLGIRRDETAPADGYFITFLRIVMKYPEVLQWNQMWYDSLTSLFAEMYGVVKLVSPERKFGLHIWHHRDFSIFERAMFDYGEIKRYADWIKPKTDHTVAGFRYRQDVRRYAQALFYDREFEKAYEAWSTLLGWDEGPSDHLPEAGLSLDYLKKNTASAIKAVNGEISIYPGIGINIPAPTRTSSPDDVRAALFAVHEAGATGVQLTRNFIEMKPENLDAAGKAIDEIRADMRRKEKAER